MTLSKESVRETSSDIPTSEAFDFDLWATKVRRQLVAALNHQNSSRTFSRRCSNNPIRIIRN